MPPPAAPSSVPLTAAPSAADLEQRLATLTLQDEDRLRRRLATALRTRDPRRGGRALAGLERQVAAAEERVAARAAGVPRITYPPELPVSQRRDDIAAAIRDAQVVVVAGETGSGKTTQLPKICLQLGRGVRGRIGHTQPRRLAARTVADRVAEELGTPLGTTVGWKVRFTDEVGPDTLVKVMTDGVLLAEIQRDRDLRQYDTIILDEAHERSLTIDFLLGYLAQLLPRRPDLKLVITSATIDPERFARHFGGAPVVEVSGRTYPVEVRYRRYGVEDDRDQTQAVLDAVDELALEAPGDVLVFLSGEREIRDTAEALRGRLGSGSATEVLPLYARLSIAEQHRVFAPHAGRRIVLATNVAETSLTVPGIRYVVDPGTARISRYSTRRGVQRLPIEAISQASANQRAGRCGRVADGVCLRLYAEEDFLSRPEFTDPEVQRTNLASVILAMAALDLGDVVAFPFIDPPDRRAVRDGVELLRELGAIEATERGTGPRLTDVGRTLAQLPVDPRLGRMVIEAGRNGCVAEVLVITAALSIQDPRERPPDQQQAADEKHRRFADPTSDFAAWLNLWQYLQEQQRALGSSAFRRLCRSEFLHFLRVREWQDVHAQLRAAARSVGIRADSSPADPVRLHTALLAGLLSHIGQLDPDAREYLGARGARFALWPGSALARKPPAWVMAGELVETSRLWGRVAARIDPAWVEPLAEHLVKRSYSEPHWSRRQGAVMAYERVTLYGVPVVARRAVGYGRIDAELSRVLFLRHALVEGDWETRHRFFHDNRALLEDVEELEHRARRRDIVVGDEELFDFYDARVPPDVVSARHFDAWWKDERHRRPDLLSFERAMLVDPAAAQVSAADFPDEWPHGGLALVLSYQFEPGTAADGVTVHVPLPVLDAAAGVGLDWQVPGLRLDLVTALVRSMPKALRRSFVPAPDTAAAVLATMAPYARPLLDALADALTQRAGVVVEPADFDLAKVPDHLRLTVRVEDEGGRVLGEGEDLAELRRRLAPQVQAELSTAADDVERAGLTQGPGETLPRSVERGSAGRTVVGYPALVDEGASVAVRVLRTPAEQERAMRLGTRRLLLLDLPSPVRAVLARLDNRTKLALGASPYPSVPALLDDAVAAAVDALVVEHGGPAWDDASWTALREHVRAELPEAAHRAVVAVAGVLSLWQELQGRLRGTANVALLPALTDVRAQLDELVAPGFVSRSGAARLPDLQRYLRAAQRRLDVLEASPSRDLERTRTVQDLEADHRRRVAALPPERRDDADVEALRWSLQELRVSLFAQTVGTPVPVSEKRVRRALDALAG